MPFHILLAEDSPTQAFRLKSELESKGWKVTLVKDGSEALAHSRETEPDLILSDILMPTMDGFQLIQELRNDPILMEIPVVLVTGTYSKAEDKVFALKIGGDGYVDKHMPTEELEEAIEQAIARRQGMVRESASPAALDSQAFAEHHRDRLLDQLYTEARELERVNEALRESEERYRKLVELSPDAIVVHDGEQILFANGASAGLLRAESPEAIVGTPIFDIVHPKFHEAVRDRIEKAGTSNQTVPPQIRPQEVDLRRLMEQLWRWRY